MLTNTLQPHNSRVWRIARLIFLLCFFVAFSSVFAAQPTERALVIGLGRDFYDGPDSRSFLHGSTHTWEALTYLGEGLNAEPWLAESWHGSDNGRTWTFRLREGVRFHDGTLLTAALAKTAVERIVSCPKYDPTGVYKDLIRLEARNTLELVFHLKRSSPRFPNLVAYYSSPIIHPKVFGENGRLTGLIGTGPYNIEKIIEGDRITLKRFKDYWGEAPAYHRVVFRTLLDAQTRAMALITGEVDAIADVGGILPQQAAALRKESGVTLKRVEVATTHYLLFNGGKPPFDTKTARQWLANWLNREELVAALATDAARVAYDPFSPLSREWAFGNLEIGPGMRPGPMEKPLVILLHSGTMSRWPYRDMAQIVQAKLHAAGFGTTIRVLEPGAYYEELQHGRFHLVMQPNTLMTGDPDFFYAYYVATNGPGYFGGGTPKMDDLIHRGRHAMDRVRRGDIYRELSLLFADQLPLLPLYHDLSLYAHGAGVTDFFMDHNFRPLLLNARPTGVR